MLFGRDKKAAEKTVLILDIEGGSVAVALARRNADGSLVILSEERVDLPVRQHRSAEALSSDSQKILAQMLPDISAQALGHGTLTDIAVFMAAPWGKPNLALGKPEFVPHMQDAVRRELSPYFETPASFYTNAGATLGGLRTIAPAEDKYLLCIVTHEMTELLLVHNGAVVGHASMPHGINLPLRTLRAHSGMSEAEARSALKLGHLHEPLGHSSWPTGEALASATEAYAGEFFAAGRDLFEATAPQRVWVVSSMGDYFAKALSHPSLSELFPQGGSVMPLRSQHASQHIPGAGGRDLFLVLESLFILYS